jgi:hypothetical protein
VDYVRRLATVSALLIAMLGVAAAPALAGFPHPVCAAKQHECGQTTKISCPCCGDQSDSSNQSGSAPSTVQVVAAPVLLSGPVAAIADTTLFHTFFRTLTAPRAGPVDLPTLFACLLI